MDSGIRGQTSIPKRLDSIPPGFTIVPQFAAEELFRQLDTEFGRIAHVAAVVFGKRDAGKSLLEAVSRLLVAPLFLVADDVATIGARGDGGLDVRLRDIAVVPVNGELSTWSESFLRTDADDQNNKLIGTQARSITNAQTQQHVHTLPQPVPFDMPAMVCIDRPATRSPRGGLQIERGCERRGERVDEP